MQGCRLVSASSVDLPTDSVQKHGTLCTELNTINTSLAPFYYTAVAGTAKQQFVAFVVVCIAPSVTSVKCLSEIEAGL